MDRVENQGSEPPVRIELQLGPRSYPVLIGFGLLSRLSRLVPTLTQRPLFLAADATVYALHGPRLEGRLAQQAPYLVPPGEEEKSLARLHDLYRALGEAGVDRTTVLVSFGGGVVGDVVGFAASTYLRGIRYLQLPTTLLAMVDSAIGGKVAINLPEGKNLVGAFHQPLAVVTDLEVLRTLPPREWRNGLAEVVKYGIIADPELFRLLEEEDGQGLQEDAQLLLELVRRCVAIKARVVERDETDQGERAILNFGHTLGHALEAVGGYRRFSHGEAVAVGMVGAWLLSERLGLVESGSVERLRQLLRRLGLPTGVREVDPRGVLGYLRQDKKRQGRQLNFVLTRGVGSAIIQPLINQEDTLLDVLHLIAGPSPGGNG